MNSKQPNFHVVILAGGAGERLWPYTKAKNPKFLLPFRDKQSLLMHTIDRVKKCADRIWIITDESYAPVIIKHVSDSHIKIIIEPHARDTAAAVLLSVLTVREVDPQATVAFVPADHFVPDTSKFMSDMHQARDASMSHDKLCLLGLKPRYAATQYGYIQVDTTRKNNSYAFSVESFGEKPSRASAQKYVADGNKWWNLGICLAPIPVFIRLFERYAQDIVEPMNRYYKDKDNACYGQIPKISFDYAVLEKSNELIAIPASFSWDDVGCLDTFLSLQPAKKDPQHMVAVDAHNNLVDVPGKLVALVGVDDLCIVEHDGALVIAARDRVGEVRKVVSRLKRET